MKKNLIAVLITAAISCTAFSCKDSGTGPNQKPFKDPREMTWTVDTLPVPEGAIQVLPKDLLVVSLTDVWLATWVGHGQIMHYDSKTWKMVKEIGGGINSLVQGNSNDIWAGGYSNTIYLGHYDGVSWTRSDDMGITGEILDMSRDPYGNIWACGRNGVVLKYSQGKWVADTIKINFSYPVEYFLKGIEYHNDMVFVLASSMNINTLVEKYFYISGNIKNWTVVDSMILDSPTSEIKWGYRGLYSKDYNKLYSYGLSGIWKYQIGGWKKIKEVEGAINGMYNADENYVMAVGDYQKVLFYNANSWVDIRVLFNLTDPTFVFRKVWTNGYETFITGDGNINGIEKTMIWHGK